MLVFGLADRLDALAGGPRRRSVRGQPLSFLYAESALLYGSMLLAEVDQAVPAR